MKKECIKLVSVFVLCGCFFNFNIKNINAFDGDTTFEEGAKRYVYTEEDLKNIKEKEESLLQNDVRGVPDAVNYTLAVECFQQINNYYCGPATVKQVIHYINGSSSSQSSYASRLGTTQSGTAMPNIAPILKSDTNKIYVYASIGTYSNWVSKVESGMKNKMPAILDINTINVSAFPYRTLGHYVNTSGLSATSGTLRVRITDPYSAGLGNRWYNATDVYNANNAHERKAMIW